jgi:hypothetical protein
LQSFPFLIGLYLPKGSLLLLYNRGWLKYYAELYLGVSSYNPGSIRLYTSIVLVPRVRGEGFSAGILND